MTTPSERAAARPDARTDATCVDSRLPAQQVHALAEFARQHEWRIEDEGTTTSLAWVLLALPDHWHLPSLRAAYRVGDSEGEFFLGPHRVLHEDIERIISAPTARERIIAITDDDAFADLMDDHIARHRAAVATLGPPPTATPQPDTIPDWRFPPN